MKCIMFIILYFLEKAVFNFIREKKETMQICKEWIYTDLTH